MSFKSIVEMFKYDSSVWDLEETMFEDKLSQLNERMELLSERLSKAESIKVGSMVSWGASGGTARGKVVRIKSEGSINVPDSSFSIKAEENNPAVLIRIYKDDKPTDKLVGHKMSTLNKMEKSLNIDLKPTQTMANNAKRGLELRREFGRGGTSVGVARARQLSNRSELSPETVARMYSFFSRHEVDKQGKDWDNAESPSNGKIAWLLWGGDSGYAWSRQKWEAIKRARGEN